MNVIASIANMFIVPYGCSAISQFFQMSPITTIARIQFACIKGKIGIQNGTIFNSDTCNLI